MKRILLPFTFLLALTSAGQSGWVKEKNELYIQLAYSSFQSDQYYNLDGALLKTAEFSQQSTVLYGEYGLGKNFAILLNYVAYRWNGFETTQTVSGTGDAFLGVQYAINEGEFPISITVGPEIPLARANRFAMSTINDFDRINLPTGDGEWNVKATLAASHRYKDLPVYASLYSTFNYRTSFEDEPFSNQVKTGLEIGYQPIKAMWIQAKIHAFASLGEPKGGSDFIRGEGTSFTAVEFTVSYSFTKRWMAVANTALYTDWVAQRKNLYSAPNYGLGIAFKLD